MKLKFEDVPCVRISILCYFREIKTSKIVSCERNSTSIDFIEVKTWSQVRIQSQKKWKKSIFRRNMKFFKIIEEIWNFWNIRRNIKFKSKFEKNNTKNRSKHNRKNQKQSRSNRWANILLYESLGRESGWRFTARCNLKDISIK